MTPLLSATDLKVAFPIRRPAFGLGSASVVKALDGVSLAIDAGEAMGVVGESGCGKSTLGRTLLGLVPEAEGRLSWMGRPFPPRHSAAMRGMRRHMQMIFQNPLASLDPRLTAGEAIALPLRTFRRDLSGMSVRALVDEMLEKVGLPRSAARCYPHQFSGGECQRIGIARALILQPRLIVCDEPTSALDVSVQGQIINLLAELRSEFQLSMLFISHNLAVVHRVCDRAIVLHEGRVVEEGETNALFKAPKHPYTQALVAAIPRLPPTPDIPFTSGARRAPS